MFLRLFQVPVLTSTAFRHISQTSVWISSRSHDPPFPAPKKNWGLQIHLQVTSPFQALNVYLSSMNWLQRRPGIVSKVLVRASRNCCQGSIRCISISTKRKQMQPLSIFPIRSHQPTLQSTLSRHPSTRNS
jgi:hypothetical protein